jgi:transcription initiation factor TFIID subunit TAF12
MALFTRFSSKTRRQTDSPTSEANLSSRSESTADKEQSTANGAAAAGSANIQSSPHRLQQYSYYGQQQQHQLQQLQQQQQQLQQQLQQQQPSSLSSSGYKMVPNNDLSFRGSPLNKSAVGNYTHF